ncbi:MAG: hypothetical protein WC464_05735 [Bdellovibrionales bacterium]
MPADVTIKIVGDEEDAEKSLESVEKAMHQVQVTSEQVSKSAKNLIPTQDLNRGADSLDDAGASASDLAVLMSGAGVQTQALMAALRAGAISGGTFTGVVGKMGMAVKGLMVSLGPVGLAVLAIGAAWQGVSYILDQNKKKLEEQKKAMEDYTGASESLYRMRMSNQQQILSMSGKEREASLLEEEQKYAEEALKNYEIIKARKDNADPKRAYNFKDDQRLVEESETAHRMRIQEINARFDKEDIKAEEEKQKEKESLVKKNKDIQSRRQEIILQTKWPGMSDEEKRLTEIDRQRELDAENLKKSLDEKIISQQEYNKAIIAINEEAQKKIDEPQKRSLQTIEEMAKKYQNAVIAYQSGIAAIEEYESGLNDLATEAEKSAKRQELAAKKVADAEKEKFTAQKSYADTMKSLNFQLAMAMAKRDGDDERMRELRIKGLMDESKITREQAESRVALEDEIAEATKERQRAERGGLETASAMYSRMMNAALEPGRQAGSMKEERERGVAGIGGAGKSNTTKEIEKSNKTLTDIYDLMNEIKRGLPLLGAAS